MIFYQYSFAFYLIFSLLLVSTSSSHAQEYNPNLGWKDSYSVDGVCYCDSNGFDHGLDTKEADTPIGSQNVVEICAAIERVLGEGAQEGRIPYNDIQCGNGPANDAADETGCPGRVDIGPEGCNQIGPKWDLETVYANLPNPEDRLDRSNWTIIATNNQNDVALMIDGDDDTRWATQQNQTPGQSIVLDLGQIETFDLIELDTTNNPNDFPRAYAVFTSESNGDWGEPIVTGASDRSITDIAVDTQSARFIRIDQNGSHPDFWWSVHELNIYRSEEDDPDPDPDPDPGPRPTPIPPSGETKHLPGILDILLSDDKL